MKLTDLHKNAALKAENAVRHGGVSDRYGKGVAQMPARKEQRRLDAPAGLVPFACKLHGDLVKQLRDRAEAAGEDINQTVDALLRAALTAPADKPSKKK